MLRSISRSSTMIVGVIGTLLALSLPSSAFAGVYAKLGSITLKSAAAPKGFESFGTFTSISFADSRQVSVGQGTEVPPTTFSRLTLTRSSDDFSGLVFASSVSGKSLGDVTVDITDAKGAKTLEIVLTGTYITDYSVSSGGDRPNESISLAFQTVTVTGFKVGTDGKVTTGKACSYDLSMLKAPSCP